MKTLTRRLSVCVGLAGLLYACDKGESAAPTAASVAPSPEAVTIASALAIPSGSGAPAASASAAAPEEDSGAAPDSGNPSAEADGPEPKAKADPHGVRLVEAGTEPRQKLRYKFVVGRTDRLQMTTTSSMKMQMGEQKADVPTAPAVRVVAALTVKDVAADGSARRTLLLEDVGLLPGPGLSKEQRDQAEKNLSALEKLTGKDRVDSRGFVRQVELDSSKIDNPALKQALASMQQTFDQMGAPFPEEAVGVGAKWQVKSRIDQMGIKLSQIADYELAEISGDKGKIKVKIQQTAPGGTMNLPGLPQGATAKLVSMRGSGKGELGFDLGRTIPDGHIDTKSEVKVSVTLAAEKQEMRTKMEARVVFRPLTK